MGCEVAIDAYIAQLIGTRDLVRKRIINHIRATDELRTEPMYSRLRKLSETAEDLMYIQSKIEENRDRFLSDCKLRSTPETECAEMNSILNSFLRSLEKGILHVPESEISFNALEASKSIHDFVDAMEKHSQSFIENCNLVQSEELIK